MPKITPDGAVVRAPVVIAKPKTDGRRRLDDWIKHFLMLGSDLESPPEYLRWAALSTIAGAAQRKIVLEAQAFIYYPNMYVNLVGPPGSKKSTAIRLGKRLLRRVPGINFTSDAPSVAGLWLEFADVVNSGQKEHQSLNCFISELSTLYENASETMTGFLTGIYDCEEDYMKRTRIGNKESIPRPWFNFIAGTTPSWLGQNLSHSAIEGGLVARTLYVYSSEIIIKSPFPQWTPELRRLADDLAHDLAHISQLYGEFNFLGGEHGDAYQWYDRWYRNPARLPKIVDNRTSGYYSRKPAHLLKVAMAVSLSRKDDLKLTIDDLQSALKLLEQIEPGMVKAFSSVGGNTFATDLDRIASQIRSGGREGLTYAELTAANYHQLAQRELDATLTYLDAMNRIKKIHTAGSPTYKSTEFS